MTRMLRKREALHKIRKHHGSNSLAVASSVVLDATLDTSHFDPCACGNLFGCGLARLRSKTHACRILP